MHHHGVQMEFSLDLLTCTTGQPPPTGTSLRDQVGLRHAAAAYSWDEWISKGSGFGSGFGPFGSDSPLCSELCTESSSQQAQHVTLSPRLPVTAVARPMPNGSQPHLQARRTQGRYDCLADRYRHGTWARQWWAATLRRRN
jgi:hypothetical protein